MNKPATETLLGTATVAQETRLRIVTDDGRSHIMLATPSSGVEADELQRLARSQARVRVRFTRSEQDIAGLAQSIEECTS